MPMQSVPLWVSILSALSTPMLAVAGSLIAFRQWRTSQSKLKLDLFERRAQVYDAARVLVSRVVTHGKTTQEDQRNYLQGVQGAKWLFGEEIRNYLDEVLWERTIALECLESELEGAGVSPERTANVHKQAEIKKWFYGQYRALDERFAPYMALRH